MTAAAPASDAPPTVPLDALPDAPGIVILHHALVDLSVENPHGYLKPDYAAEIAPEYETEVRVEAQDGGRWHVEPMLRLSARAGLQVVFVAEISYRAEVMLHNVGPEDAPRILNVEVPEALMPTMRAILQTCGAFAGYPDMAVGEIDFAGAYARRLARGA